MPAHEVVTESPAYSTPDTSLQEAAQLMVDCDCGAIPVVQSKDTHAPLGIITDRDITMRTVTRTVAQGKNPLQLRAQDAMTPSTVQARPSDEIDRCAASWWSMRKEPASASYRKRTWRSRPRPKSGGSGRGRIRPQHGSRPPKSRLTLPDSYLQVLKPRFLKPRPLKPSPSRIHHA